MPYDVSSPRYAHLKGLTQNEISLVMTIADTAISQAKKEFEQNESSISPKDQSPNPADQPQTGVPARRICRVHAPDVDQNCNK
jgi:hypothetical protein